MKPETVLFNICIYTLVAAVVLAAVRQAVKAGRGGKAEKAGPSAWDKAPLWAAGVCLALVTAFLVIRSVQVGHGPFTSMFEFSVSFVWGILLMGILFSVKYKNLTLNLAALAAGLALILFAGTLSPEAAPLVPALQNSLLLSVHVLTAVIAYGAFTIGFISSLLIFFQRKGRAKTLPDPKTLEKISYHSVMVGFPFLTLVIILGAVWADIAWGSYWSWDPKETASLVTWLVYAGYLHTRIVRKWSAQKTSVLLIIGFLAVLFTFFGNYIFSGLHSYT